MKSIRCSFYAANIFILITQVAIAQTSESLNGQAWLNMNDGSLIVEIENFNKLNGLNKPLQNTPSLQDFLKLEVIEQGTPNVGVGPESPNIINNPTIPKDICEKYPFVEGCNQ